MTKSNLLQMHNMGIVVESLNNAILQGATVQNSNFV